MDANLKTDVERLRSSDAAERTGAAERIAQRGTEAAGAAIVLVEAVRDESDEAREWVVAALEGLEAPSAADAGRLAALAADSNADVAYWAATLVGRLGPAARSEASALATALAQSHSTATQRRIVWALEQIEVGSPDVMAALAAAETSGDRPLAAAAARAKSRLAG